MRQGFGAGIAGFVRGRLRQSGSRRSRFRLRLQWRLLQALCERPRWLAQAREWDFVVLIPEQSAGWIIEAIFREIIAHSRYRGVIHIGYDHIPIANRYIFGHQAHVHMYLMRVPWLFNAQLYTFFTHPSHYVDQRELDMLLRFCRLIIPQCSQMKRYLIKRGHPPSRVAFIIGGAVNHELFYPGNEQRTVIGLSGAYYPRKNPGLIIAVARAMPHRQFVLLGKRWQYSKWYPATQELPNLTLVDEPWQHYPNHYRQMRVFFSPSWLEGGPIPLLEAMACGAIPVVSRTGMAEDLIQHGVNGYIFDPAAEAAQVCALLECAWSLAAAPEYTVATLTWERMAQRYDQLLFPGGVGT